MTVDLITRMYFEGKYPIWYTNKNIALNIIKNIVEFDKAKF